MADITLIIGEEDYLADFQVGKLAAVGAHVRTVSSLSDDDLFWMRSFSLDFSPKVLILEVDELGANDKLLEQLESGELGNGFCIRCRKAKTNTKIYKWLQKNAKVVKCDQLSETFFDKFLRRNNGTVNMKITEENLSYLKERLDYSSGRISLREIDLLMQMLSLFDEVTREDIDAYVTASAERKAFDIVDLIAKKDFEGAVRAAGEYDDSCIMALGSMLWSFRLALSLKMFSADETGATPYQYRNVKPFLNYPLDTLELVFSILNSGLRKMKSGMPEKACFVATVGLVADRLT